MSGPKHRRFRWLCRWTATAASLGIGCLFLYSARFASSWTNQTLTRSVTLHAASIGFFKSPPGAWADSKTPPQPGWEIGAELAGGLRVNWWFERFSTRRWTGIEIPLWMPFVIFALPAAGLWYRDRRQVAERTAKFLVRFRPAHRLKLRLRNVILANVAHVFLLLSSSTVFQEIRLRFLFLDFPGEKYIFPVLLLGAPLFAVAEAMLWIAFRNRLFNLHREHPVCSACGYNLTGNVSGRCPECGEATGAEPDTRDRSHEAPDPHESR